MKLSFLKGKKTYLVMGAMLLAAFIGALADDTGTVDLQSFLGAVDWRLVLEALGIGALRAGIAKAGG